MAPMILSETAPRYSSIHSFSKLLNTSSLPPPPSSTSTSGGETLRHARVRLDARNYQQRSFALGLLSILRKLHLIGSALLSPEDLSIHKVSGALTNAVFFVSSQQQTVLLRVYGPSTSSLLSRTRELQTLHLISTKYNIGPKIYGTFDNGRIEEYFDSEALTSVEMRLPEMSGWIAARMAELHSVDVKMIDDIQGNGNDTGTEEEYVRTVEKWYGPAQAVLELNAMPESVRAEIDLGRFGEEWERYVGWVRARPETFGMRRVFAHNDAQYGNLLRLRESPSSSHDESHRQLIVVDFEYAAANPAAYDIANHFHEWTTNYHGPSPHAFCPAKYPSLLERRNFYSSYIHHSSALHSISNSIMMEELDKDIEAMTPASHAAGALWGIIQAREDVRLGRRVVDFDYVSYAIGRMAAFRRDLLKLGIVI